MAKFLFIYRESTESRAKPSPEEMQALATAWGVWMQKFSSAIVPGGDGLKHDFNRRELVPSPPSECR